MSTSKTWGLSGEISWDDGEEGWTEVGQSVIGTSYGAIQMKAQGDYLYSEVTDTGQVFNVLELSHTERISGYGVEYRHDSSSFGETDETPEWYGYASQVQVDRYIQLRVQFRITLEPA